MLLDEFGYCSEYLGFNPLVRSIKPYMHLNSRDQGLVGSLNHGKIKCPVGGVCRASKSHHDLVVVGVVSYKSEDSEGFVLYFGDLNDSWDLTACFSALPVFNIIHAGYSK